MILRNHDLIGRVKGFTSYMRILIKPARGLADDQRDVGNPARRVVFRESMQNHGENW